MNYIIKNELVDTYGGDYTFKNVWYEKENGKYIFYKEYIGAKEKDAEIVEDEEEIKEYKKLLKNKNG